MRFQLHLFGCQLPGQHRSGIASFAVHDGGDRKIENLAANGNPRFVRQIFGVGKQTPLMRRVLVKNIDRLTDQGIDLDRQDMLDLTQNVARRFIDVSDAKILQFADHHIDGNVFKHLHCVVV